MKPAEARRLAQAHDRADLQRAASALCEDTDAHFEVAGADHGEKLTHVLLAIRIREKVDAGVDLKEAYREVMAGVREVLHNE
jgi:hypothetical protein